MVAVCPYLSRGYVYACKADQQIYIPSIAELEKYCMNEKHMQCPSYCLTRE